MSELTIHLNDEDEDLLQSLSMCLHKPADQLIADLVRIEYDRVFPGKRLANANLAPGEAFERLRQRMGWPELPDDPEAERELAEKMALAQAEADRIYGRRARAAA